MPRIDDLREQRFNLKVYAKVDILEWAHMVPWQREDFCERFMKYQEELARERARLEADIKAKMASIRTK